MEKLKILLIILLVGHVSFGQDNQMPSKYKPIKEAYGDLNKDGIPEKVVVYNMNDTIDEIEGVDREIVVFKKEKDGWKIWHRSTNAVGNSKDGGMMGDPFEDIEIINGILHIKQSGGSSWKWGHVDKYRFQNNAFELIGYSSYYGKPCEYWEDFDFNVSTGKIDIKKEYETCENQQQVISKKENEIFIYKVKDRIKLENRQEIELEIISPKYKHHLYL